MKTDLLFYQDAYQQALPQTAVIARQTIADHPAVALAETLFYPTGGGQPFDRGRLNGVDVIDVIKADNGMVWHVLAAPLDDQMVTGNIDWARRFDFMQQHTGQHILSRAFEVLFDANTVGFHLTENTLTIDLDRDDLSVEMVMEAEDLANQIVIQNVDVKTWFPDEATLAALPLRKLSDKVTGSVRVVHVGEFDVCACGGTHVATSGEIGMIKVLKQERAKQQTRLEFMCGGRALLDYRAKNSFLLDVAAQFTTGWQEIPAMLDKLRDENKALNKALKALQETVMGYRAAELWAAADHRQNPAIITFVSEDLSMSGLQQLARLLVANVNAAALLATSGESAQLVFARSDDLPDLDMVPYLKQALQTLGTSRGGGRSNMAQGGGVAATTDELQALLSSVATAIQQS